MYNSLNDDSLKRINNIVNNFKIHPSYAKYTIKSYTYDVRIGVHALEISKNGSLINLWLFFPTVDGKIESIAVYGAYLQGHLNAIRSSMTVFGMRVSSVEMSYGNDNFVDIMLERY